MGNTMTSIFDGDMFFPDNPQRESRLRDLCGDLTRLAAENALAYDAVRAAAATIDERLVQYGISPDTLPGNGEAFRRNAVLFPLYTQPRVFMALTMGASCADGGGDSDQETLMAVLFPSLDLGLSLMVLNGEERRSKLREGIAGALPARLRLQEAVLLNKRLVMSLTGINDGLQVLVEMLPPDIVKEQLRERAEGEAAAISRQDFTQEAIHLLNEVDQRQGSWTEEDVHFGAQ